MSNRYYIILATIAAMVSCQKPEMENTPAVPGSDPVFTATIETTKTTITPADGKVAWDGDEEITITDAGSTSVVYEVSSVTDGKATFTKKAGEAGTLGAGPYTAIYGTAPAASQTYSATVTDLPMTASSATKSLTFSVSCGLLKITLTKASTSISSIAVGDGTNVYTLNCSPAVDISSPKDFYIAVPEGTYKRFAFQNSAGKYCVKTAKSESETVIAANDLKPIRFSSSLAFNTTLVHNVSELTTALSGVADGDKILLAAGTYTLSSTISITNAITLEGGYSASPSAADFPDPIDNKAVLDGGNTRRVMTVTAPAVSGKNVSLSGIALQNGASSTDNGAGLFVNQGTVSIDYVDIKDNTCSDKKMGAGFTITGVNTDVALSNCVISGNTTNGNGGNYITSGAKVSINNCIFKGNSAGNGNALLLYDNNAHAINVSISNSEFSENSGGRGALYLRGDNNNSNGVTINVVNCTFWGNTSNAAGGSAIAVYGKETTPLTIANICSCTITGNTCNGNSGGGALYPINENRKVTVRLYNSIVSGNTYDYNSSKADVDGTSKNFYSIVGSSTYANDALDDTAPSFDVSTMLSKKTITADQTQVFSLIGESNPAKTKGHDNLAGLNKLTTAFGIPIVTSDQWGNSRSGRRIMGAYVGD